MATQIIIPAKTIVAQVRDKNGPCSRLVTLTDMVIVEATRETDGSWLYRIGRNWFACSGGLASACAD